MHPDFENTMTWFKTRLDTITLPPGVGASPSSSKRRPAVSPGLKADLAPKFQT